MSCVSVLGEKHSSHNKRPQYLVTVDIGVLKSVPFVHRPV